jgi:hypothetical protein
MIMVVVVMAVTMMMTISTVMSVPTRVMMVAARKSECSECESDDRDEFGEAKLHAIDFLRGCFLLILQDADEVWCVTPGRLCIS